MYKMIITISAMLLSATSVANPNGIPNDPHQLIVQVNGIVCSFCAYGTEKNLSKLDFLDKSRFGDGVLVDITSHQVTLALDPEASVNYAEIADAITKGGYDPVAYYPVVRGVLLENDGHLEITNPENGQVYRLPEGTDGGQNIGQMVQCSAELSPEYAAEYNNGDSVMLNNVVIEALRQ